jgi:hypothetical protein
VSSPPTHRRYRRLLTCEPKQPACFIDRTLNFIDPRYRLHIGHGALGAGLQRKRGGGRDTTTMHTRPLLHAGNPPCPQGQIELAYLVAGACTIVNGDGNPHAPITWSVSVLIANEC